MRFQGIFQQKEKSKDDIKDQKPSFLLTAIE
jgi:hypothetical protein